MLDRIKEMCLFQYFTVETVLGERLEKRKQMFEALKNSYCIAEMDAERVFSPEIAEIRTKNDYYRHRRTMQYLSMFGRKDGQDALTEAILAVKGEAIAAVEDHKLKFGPEVTGKSIYDSLSDGRFRGDLMAMRLRGFMQCEGIFMTRDRMGGIRQLQRCAAWDDLPSILLCLYYDADNRPAYLGWLTDAVEGTPYADLAARCAETYGIEPGPRPPERKLLRKAFYRGILSQDVYDPAYDRILRSRALSLREKENLLFTCPKEAVMTVSELPLSGETARDVPFSGHALEKVPFRRPEEQEILERMFANADLCTQESYKPLCISSASAFVLHAYMQHVQTASERVQISVIHAQDLGEQDLEPTANSVFIQSFREDCRNVFFLLCTGKVNPRVIEQIQSFLKTKNRKTYRMNGLRIAVDLSTVVPVVFCDTANERNFRPFCDVVAVGTIAPKETEVALEALLEEKREQYGLSGLGMSADLSAALRPYDIDRISEAMDTAIRQNRIRDNALELTYEMLGADLEQKKRGSGFGFDGGY